MLTTGLSGHEIYCLNKVGYKAGDLLVGNSVHSMGVIGGLRTSARAIVGGEMGQITQLIHEGRQTAYGRMEAEAKQKGAVGITGVTSELIVQSGGMIEFLSIGSAVHGGGEQGREELQFSTSTDGQELYSQMDAGYKPIKFAFGNVAYSIGVARGVLGSLKTLVRGEVREFSEIFNTTRHLALQRVVNEAAAHGANAVVGIETTILPLMGASGIQEMLMIGTASHNDALSSMNGVVTSDLTCQEMWNLTKMGYAPIKLLLGTSVYSLGFVGGITSFFKSFVKGEIPELSTMIYEAREHSLGIINDEAKSIGADEVVGVKTYVYEIGSGLIEFLAIGTAVKKMPGVTTKSDELIPQAFMTDRDTFVNTAEISMGINLNTSDV